MQCITTVNPGKCDLNFAKTDKTIFEHKTQLTLDTEMIKGTFVRVLVTKSYLKCI